jgi:ribonuclease BN (tRNA processing enzyme)
MLLAGIDITEKPTHLFISHFHPDHCSDIIALMQGRGVAAFKENIKPLFIGGPEGLNQFCKDIFENVTKWKSFSDELNVYQLLDLHEVVEEVVAETKNWKVTCAPIKHFNGSCYRLDINGKSIIYSGDMIYDENITKIGQGADIAIMECSYPDRNSLGGAHLCPEDIGKLAKLGKFKKIILTHMYPKCEGRENEMVAKIKEVADVEVVVAYDLLKLEI